MTTPLFDHIHGERTKKEYTHYTNKEEEEEENTHFRR